jgi:catechol-2,3-dioxygenase
MSRTPPIDPRVEIGHVHLEVTDLERALAFYCGVLGFQLTQRFGASAAFVSAGGYHHHIGLNTWESCGGSPPPPGATGRLAANEGQSAGNVHQAARGGVAAGGSRRRFVSLVILL